MLFYFQSLEYETYFKRLLDSFFRYFDVNRNGTAFVCVVIVLIVMDNEFVKYIHNRIMLLHEVAMCNIKPERLDDTDVQATINSFIEQIETYERQYGTFDAVTYFKNKLD